MFLITIDKSGRLLVEQSVASANGGSKLLLNLPTLPEGSSPNVISRWINENGAGEASDIAFFDIYLSTRRAPSKYAICNIGEASLSSPRFVLRSLDEIWKQEIDSAIAVAMNQIVKHVAFDCHETSRMLQSSFENVHINKPLLQLPLPILSCSIMYC